MRRESEQVDPADMADEIEKLRTAMAALEAQRQVLGDAVVEAALAPVRARISQLEGEGASGGSRRHVTVLLADLAGFTALGERMDPEVLADLMGEIWDALDSVISGHGGEIEKHMGDAVLSVWGRSAASESDTRQAVLAGLAMQAKLADMGGRLVSTPGFPSDASLKMRIAVHVGPVFVGGASEGDPGRTSTGDTVNIVSRMEKLAPPGGVLVSEEAWRLVRGLFEAVEQAPVRLRGRTGSFRTWVVGRALPRGFVDPSRGLAGAEVPMVGRTEELQRLMDLFTNAESEGSAGLVVIAGEAGVGQSRLLREFEKKASGASEDSVFLRGRAAPETASMPYGVVRDMVLGWLGLTESCANEDALGRMMELAGGALDSRRAEGIVRLLGFGSSSDCGLFSAEGDLLFFFGAALRRKRAVMLLEDLHWADDATIRLVETFVRERPGGGFLAVCTTRPSFFEKAPRWGSSTAGHELMALDPLAEGDARTLLESLLAEPGRVSPELAGAVLGRSDGNPLFMEEILRTFLDAGSIGITDGGWGFLGPDAEGVSMSIPPGLNGLLLSRLDSIPPDEREMLQHASVIGDEFWDSALAEVSGIPQAVVAETLGRLEMRRLVARSPRSSFEGSIEFGFHHHLIREASYSTVLLKKRRDAHLKIASWLERSASSSADAFHALIARHLENSGLPDRAADRYLKAGEGALARSAFRDALGNFDRGLAAAGRRPGETRVLLLAGRGNALEKLSRYREAEKSATLAAEEAAGMGFPTGEARALNVLSLIFSLTGRYDEAERASIDALDRARASGDKPSLARALSRMATFAGAEGYEHQIGFHEQALQLYSGIGDRAGQGLCHLNMGNCAYAAGHFRDARRFWERGLAVYRALDHTWGMSNSLANLSLLEEREGELHRGDQACEGGPPALVRDRGPRECRHLSRQHGPGHAGRRKEGGGSRLLHPGPARIVEDGDLAVRARDNAGDGRASARDGAAGMGCGTAGSRGVVRELRDVAGRRGVRSAGNQGPPSSHARGVRHAHP